MHLIQLHARCFQPYSLQIRGVCAYAGRARQYNMLKVSAGTLFANRYGQPRPDGENRRRLRLDMRPIAAARSCAGG
eukprot:1063188-Pyramimonas_sp.AAC.1